MSACRSLLIGITVAFIVGAVDAQNNQLKIATLVPEGSFWMQQTRLGAEEIAERTHGRVTFRFYPGGTMGTDQVVLRKMRIGQLHGGALLAGSLAQVNPDLEIYNLPLMFRSYDEVDHVRRQFDDRLLVKLANDGLVAFGFVETGFVYLMSSKATRSFQDLEGRRTWMPEGDPISKAIVDAAGLSPVPLAISDVLTGLQTGLIDTVAAPPVGAVALQWFTKAKFVTDLPITYVYGLLVLSDRAYQRIAPEDQAVVREVLGRVSATLDRSAREDNRQAREALERQGVEFVSPTQPTRQRWSEVASRATALLVERQGYDRSLLEAIQRELERYRAQSTTGPSG